MNTVEFVPFKATVDAGIGAVMVGHIALPQIDATAVKPLPENLKSKPTDTDQNGEIIEEKAAMPATMSPVIGNILRNDLKFHGMIVTDALSMSGLTIYFTPEESAVRALEAGADMLLKPVDVDAAFRGVRDAVKSGRLTEQRIEESARKILAAKYDLGLLDQRLTPVDAIDRIVSSKEVYKLAGEVAERAVTLVRDEDKQLPLKNLKPETRVFNNAAADVTKVGELELEGKIALARGDKQAGIDLLTKAIAAEDATYYAEPADWDLPVREGGQGERDLPVDLAVLRSVRHAQELGARRV